MGYIDLGSMSSSAVGAIEMRRGIHEELLGKTSARSDIYLMFACKRSISRSNYHDMLLHELEARAERGLSNRNHSASLYVYLLLQVLNLASLRAY